MTKTLELYATSATQAIMIIEPLRNGFREAYKSLLNGHMDKLDNKAETRAKIRKCRNYLALLVQVDKENAIGWEKTLDHTESVIKKDWSAEK